MGFGGLLKMFGEKKTKNPYQPYKPYIRNYEALQRQDIGSLYGQVPDGKGGFKPSGARPYDDPNLGYNAQEMEGLYGKGRDVLAGEAGAETQRTADRFRSPGGLGLRSAMYARAQQRSDLERVGRANSLRRDMIVRNAQQKRADLLARIAAVTGAYGQGVNTYNNYVGGYNQRVRKTYAGAAEGLDAIVGAASGGAMMG